MKLLKLSFREILRSWKFSIGFVLSLSLGLSGFLIIESYRDSLTEAVTLNSKNILSADIEVSARRKISDSELKIVRKVISDSAEDFLVAEMPYYEFMAMINTEKGSRLVTVKAISDSYPYYGELVLKSGKRIRENTKHKDFKNKKVKNIWVSQDLQNQMELVVDDKITLGNLKFTVSQIVVEDSTQTLSSQALAPTVYIYIGFLEETGLIKYGSTFSHRYMYKFPKELSGYDNLDKIQQKLYGKLKDPSLRVNTPRTASDRAGRQLNYLFDFLGLVAIVALFLSCLGATYLFRLYLSRKYKQIAIYRTLGIFPSQIFFIYSIQVIFLSIVALIPAFGFSEIFIPVFRKLLSTLTSFELDAKISSTSIVICFIISVLGSFLSIFPKLISIQSLKPLKLFSEDKFSTEPSNINLLFYIPLVIFYVALSIYQVKSFYIGTSFVATIGAVMLLLVVGGAGFFKLFENLTFTKAWYFKYSYLSMSRKRGASMAVFVSIGLGALLINLLPQLKHSLQKEFEIGKNTPSLFLFDIQDNQLQPLKNFLKKQGVDLVTVSPLIRSRILKINGVDYERKVNTRTFKTREEEREVRFRNRGINLSYRPQLSDSEEIIKGKFFEQKYDPLSNQPFGLSLEKRYADRMDLNIGDRLVFDVQGMELEGVVESIRTVKWASFQPNFFILVQEGVLEDAPKTHIASLGSLNSLKKAEIQKLITKKFPNISAIDVTRVVNNVLKISSQMSWSLELMSLLALLSGYIVLFSIIRSHLETRYYEINLLKIFGGSFGKLTSYILNEYVTLTFLASLVGVSLSIFVSYGISYYVFEGVFTVEFSSLFGSITLITALSAIVSFVASFKIFRAKPSDILQLT